MLIVSLALVSLVLRAPHRCRVPPPQMLKGRALPDELRELGMDDALWAATRNKKGLLQLLRKGKTEFLESRIQNLREIIDDAPAATRVTQATQAAQEALAAPPAPAATAPPSSAPPPPAAPGKSLQEVAKELAAAQMPEELRPYGMDEPLWLEVKDKRSLIKLLRRREFDFLEARITTLRAKFAEDGIDLAPAAPPAAGTPEAVVAAAAESEEWFEEGAEEAGEEAGASVGRRSVDSLPRSPITSPTAGGERGLDAAAVAASSPSGPQRGSTKCDI